MSPDGLKTVTTRWLGFDLICVNDTMVVHKSTKIVKVGETKQGYRLGVLWQTVHVMPPPFDDRGQPRKSNITCACLACNEHCSTRGQLISTLL